MVLLLLLTSVYLHMGFSQYLVILSLALLYLWLPGCLLIHCNLCSVSVRLRVDCADNGSPVWRFPYLLRWGGSLWLSTHAPHLSLGLIPLLFQLSINRARGMPDQSSCSMCRSCDNSPDDSPWPPLIPCILWLWAGMPPGTVCFTTAWISADLIPDPIYFLSLKDSYVMHFPLYPRTVTDLYFYFYLFACVRS